MFAFIQQQLSKHLIALLLGFFSLPLLHTTNTFPRSDSTCAQGICLRFSQQISLGQGLRLASSNRLLKIASRHDERGKWIFQLKSRIISAQGIILCSKRLIKWDAIDTALCCSCISAGHVHWQLLTLKYGYTAVIHEKRLCTDACWLLFVTFLHGRNKCNEMNTTFLKSSHLWKVSRLLNYWAVLRELSQTSKGPKMCFLLSC